MRIGFTGTQKGMTKWQQIMFGDRLRELGATEFVFGDCIGADIEAAQLALANGIRTFTIFPQNKDTRKRAWFFNTERDIKRENGQYRNVLPCMQPNGCGVGEFKVPCDNCANPINIRWMPAEPPLSRNLRIIDNCDYVIACPKEFEHTIRSGTWATIRYAWKRKKDKITIIPPLDREDRE